MGGQTGCAKSNDSMVNILKVENGWVITIGCKTFVSKEWQEISDGLKLYFENPEEAERKFCNK